MMGLAYLIFFAVYIGLSVWLTRLAVKVARARGIAGWKYGLPVALVMYHLVFWDWIPTIVTHQYYCAKESGFWVYKTLDQWNQENPGVMETLVANPVSIQRVGDEENHVDTSIYNQRFNKVSKRWRPIRLFPVYGYSRQIVDSANGEELARYVDFSSGKGSDYLKFWMNNQGCSNGTENRAAYLRLSEKLANMIDTSQRSVK